MTTIGSAKRRRCVQWDVCICLAQVHRSGRPGKMAKKKPARTAEKQALKAVGEAGLSCSWTPPGEDRLQDEVRIVQSWDFGNFYIFQLSRGLDAFGFPEILGNSVSSSWTASSL